MDVTSFRFRAALVLLCFGVGANATGCYYSGGGNGDGSDVPDGAVPPIEAGEPARSAGVGWYEDLYVEVTTQTALAVTVSSPEGAHFGALRMSYGVAGEFEVTFTSHTGEVAALNSTSHVDEGAGIIEHRSELTAAGRSLTTTTVTASALASGADDATWVTSVRLSTPLDPGALLPGAGALLPDGRAGGESATLEVVRDGIQVAAPSEVALWLTQTGASVIRENAAATMLLATTRDSSLYTAIEGRIEAHGERHAEGSLQSVGQASHNAEVCGLVDTIIATDSNDLRRRACGTCLNQSNGFDFLFTGQLLLVCHGCSVSIGLGLEHLFACAAARTSPDVWNDQRCQTELPAPGNGALLFAREDGHGCQAICVQSECDALCGAAYTPRGIPFSAACSGADQATCLCRPDPEAACAQRAGAIYCGGAVLTEAELTCPTARCGDGRITSSCPNLTSLQEVCDTAAAPTGCGSGLACSSTCVSCDPTCECTPGALPSSCAPGTECGANCQCVPIQSDCRSQIGSSSRWCDPARGAAACPAGTVCDSTECECSYCGDDLVNGTEECEPDVAGASCSAERSCVDCRCVTNCGNGTVDPGEHCDPAGGAACDTGYRCESCTCVEAVATCGDGICDRVGGESESSCAQDCPLVCGDGRCNVTGGETAATCPSDCSSGEVACCVETAGCATEELYSCPGDCCCCGSGARCVRHAATWICGM